MSIYDPPIKPRKPAPAASPAVSYVRPDGPAPQGKFGSPSAMGFSPAYTSSVPKSQPSIWSQALTKVGGQAAASFLQSPSKPVQQLAYNSTIGSLASPEFLMNNNLSPLRGIDPSFKPTWQESIQGPFDAAGFMAAPMFTLGLAGADAAGVKNETNNTLLGTGAIVTAINVWKNKGNPVAAVNALWPMVNAYGFGLAANWVQENIGANIHGLAPWFLQKANTLGPYPEKPWPRQEYWQDATKKLTDTNTPIVNPYADPPWERGGYRFEPVNRSKGRVKFNGGGVFEDFDFQTGKWIERVPRPTWMQQFMQNFRNAITPQWKMQDPVPPSKPPLQITTSKPPPLVKQDIKPYGTEDFNLETIKQDIAWLDEQKPKLDIPKEIKNRDDWTEIDPKSIPPWEFLKNSPEREFTDQVFLGDFWKTVRENPTLDPYKIWEVMSDNKNEVLTGKPSPLVDPDDGLPVAEDYTKEEWESYKKSLDTYIDPLGNEWDSKDQWDYFQQSLQDYAAGLQPPKQESIDDATRRLAAQMSEGGERPVSYYQELLRQSYKTFEDLANAGTDFNRFPTDVTPNKWIEDNNTFLPSMMGKDNLPMSGFGASTSPSDDALEPWDYKQRPPGYFDERGSFRTNNPLRSMGNEPIKTLPMGQLGVSAQIQLRRDIFMGADLNKLPEPTKKAIYESFDMGWHPGLGDDEEDNSRMAGIFEAITGFPQPESNVGDGEYDTGNYMVEEYPLMEYINSPESGLPNLSDYLVPTGQDAEGRMTFEGDYYKWEQDFREAWRDNPGLFRDTKLHPEFLAEWANPIYRDNSGE